MIITYSDLVSFFNGMSNFMGQLMLIQFFKRTLIVLHNLEELMGLCHFQKYKCKNAHNSANGIRTRLRSCNAVGLALYQGTSNGSDWDSWRDNYERSVVFLFLFVVVWSFVSKKSKKEEAGKSFQRRFQWQKKMVVHCISLMFCFYLHIFCSFLKIKIYLALKRCRLLLY